MKSNNPENKLVIEHDISPAAISRAIVAGLLVCAVVAHFTSNRGITASGTPFHGSPALAGQPIRATNFDLTNNNDNGSDSNLASTKKGDRWNYTLTIPSTGLYVFSARACASAAGARFHAEFDGATVTGSLPIPKTDAPDNWNTVASRCFQLTAGTHVLQVAIDANMNGKKSAGSFDVFNITPVPPNPIHWTAAAPSPEKRFEGYAATYNGKLYAFGGFNSLIHPYSVNTTASVYDPATNIWSRLSDIPAAPTHAGLAKDPENGLLYFVGGLQGDFPGFATPEVWAYDITHNTWAPMPPLPAPLAAGEAVLINGDLHYLAGIGAKDRNTNVSAHYVLTLGTNQWRPASPLPTPRDHVSAVPLNGKLYAFGGEIGHDAHHRQQTRSDVYDPATDTWTRLADMPLSKSHSEPSAFVSDGKIIIAGGQIDNYAATNTILQYDPATNTWSLLGNLPGPLQGTMLQQIGNQLILTNGYDGTHMRTATWTTPWPPVPN